MTILQRAGMYMGSLLVPRLEAIRAPGVLLQQAALPGISGPETGVPGRLTLYSAGRVLPRRQRGPPATRGTTLQAAAARSTRSEAQPEIRTALCLPPAAHLQSLLRTCAAAGGRPQHRRHSPHPQGDRQRARPCKAGTFPPPGHQLPQGTEPRRSRPPDTPGWWPEPESQGDSSGPDGLLSPHTSQSTRQTRGGGVSTCESVRGRPRYLAGRLQSPLPSLPPTSP